MLEGWKTYKLGDLASLGDGAHSKVKRLEEGVLYLTSKNFKEGRLHLDKIDYISKEDYNKLFCNESKAINKPSLGDLLMGIIGTLGNVYLYKETDKFGISSSVAIIRPNNDKVNSSYLYYYITGREFKHYQNAHNGASVQGYTNLPSLRSIPIKTPLSLQEQRAIASILTALDDKIELNLQMNKTLEEMALALYKHWFVDFGPFQNGEFVDVDYFGVNTKIQIPSTFKVNSVKNLITRLKTKSKYDQKNVLNNGLVRVFDQSSSRILGYHNNVPDFRSNFHSPILVFGDHTCRMELICEDFSVGPNLIPFKSKDNINSYLLYLGLKERVNMNDYKRHWSELMLHQLILPKDVNVINDFNSKIKDSFSLITKNDFENNTLTTLRDTLLPKLISGEVRVKEIKQTIAQVL